MLHSSGDAREHFITAIQTSITETACHPHSSVGVFHIFYSGQREGAEPCGYEGHHPLCPIPLRREGQQGGGDWCQCLVCEKLSDISYISLDYMGDK